MIAHAKRSTYYITAGLLLFLLFAPGLVFENIPSSAFWPTTIVTTVLMIMGIYEAVCSVREKTNKTQTSS